MGGGAVLCVRSTGLHVWAVIGNGSCLPTALLWGFYTIKGKTCFLFLFLVPYEPASQQLVDVSFFHI